MVGQGSVMLFQISYYSKSTPHPCASDCLAGGCCWWPLPYRSLENGLFIRPYVRTSGGIPSRPPCVVVNIKSSFAGIPSPDRRRGVSAATYDAFAFSVALFGVAGLATDLHKAVTCSTALWHRADLSTVSPPPTTGRLCLSTAHPEIQNWEGRAVPQYGRSAC